LTAAKVLGASDCSTNAASDLSLAQILKYSYIDLNYYANKLLMTTNQVTIFSEQDRQLNPSQDDTYQMSLTAAMAAEDRKAEDILILAVGEVSVLADYFVIATGFSKAQVRAIASAVSDKIAEQFHRTPIRSSGESEASWILHDYGDLIVHIMMPKEREFYSLEAFWGHAPRFMLSKDV
jgi:ribosome-associated protein